MCIFSGAAFDSLFSWAEPLKERIVALDEDLFLIGVDLCWKGLVFKGSE